MDNHPSLPMRPYVSSLLVFLLTLCPIQRLEKRGNNQVFHSCPESLLQLGLFLPRLPPCVLCGLSPVQPKS